MARRLVLDSTGPVSRLPPDVSERVLHELNEFGASDVTGCIDISHAAMKMLLASLDEARSAKTGWGAGSGTTGYSIADGPIIANLSFSDDDFHRLFAPFYDIIHRYTGKRDIEILQACTVLAPPGAPDLSAHYDHPERAALLNIVIVSKSTDVVLTSFRRGSHNVPLSEGEGPFTPLRRARAVLFDGRVMHLAPANDALRTRAARMFFCVAVKKSRTSLEEAIVSIYGDDVLAQYKMKTTVAAKRAFVATLRAPGVVRKVAEAFASSTT